MKLQSRDKIELVYSSADVVERTTLVLDDARREWRGNIDRRERLVCAMLPSAVLVASYSVVLSMNKRRLSVTCTFSVDGVAAEANVTGTASCSLAVQMHEARALAIVALASKLAVAVEACDARLCALAASQVCASRPAELVSSPEFSDATRDLHVARGSYLAQGSSGTSPSGLGRHRNSGYLGSSAQTLTGASLRFGSYGPAATQNPSARGGGYVVAGRMARPSAPDASEPSRARTTETAGSAELDVAVEAQALSLLRMQSILNALQSTMQ
jgi:hypothetical protein